MESNALDLADRPDRVAAQPRTPRMNLSATESRSTRTALLSWFPCYSWLTPSPRGCPLLRLYCVDLFRPRKMRRAVERPVEPLPLRRRTRPDLHDRSDKLQRRPRPHGR